MKTKNKADAAPAQSGQHRIAELKEEQKRLAHVINELASEREELLEALKAITDEVDALCADDYAGTHLETLRDNARAAIAKAEGRTS